MTQWVWPAVKGGGGDRWWISKVRTNRERSVRTCSDSFNTYPLPPLMLQHRNCFARNRRMEIAFQTDCHCNWHCHCQICEKTKADPLHCNSSWRHIMWQFQDFLQSNWKDNWKDKSETEYETDNTGKRGSSRDNPRSSQKGNKSHKRHVTIKRIQSRMKYGTHLHSNLQCTSTRW